jgi:hypothetical protein
MITRVRLATILLTLILASCAHQMYWRQYGKSLQATNADLLECHARFNESGPHVLAFSNYEIESPCMSAKGYYLDTHPSPE